jgi:hypothetical protein
LPEQDYQISGNTLRFPANIEKPSGPDEDIPLTVKYYPRQRVNTASSPTPAVKD